MTLCLLEMWSWSLASSVNFLPQSKYGNMLLLIGQIYFSSGKLLSRTFIKFLDSWTDWISFLEVYSVSSSINRSQFVPKFTRQFSISISCLGSIFYERFYTIIDRALRQTPTMSKSSLWHSERISRMQVTKDALFVDLNSSSASKLIMMPKL